MARDERVGASEGRRGLGGDRGALEALAIKRDERPRDALHEFDETNGVAATLRPDPLRHPVEPGRFGADPKGRLLGIEGVHRTAGQAQRRPDRVMPLGAADVDGELEHVGDAPPTRTRSRRALEPGSVRDRSPRPPSVLGPLRPAGARDGRIARNRRPLPRCHGDG